MKILPYNRVVKDIKGMCKAEFFLKVSEKFDYEETEIKTPQKGDEFCLYIDGKWYKLTAKKHLIVLLICTGLDPGILIWSVPSMILTMELPGASS